MCGTPASVLLQTTVLLGKCVTAVLPVTPPARVHLKAIVKSAGKHNIQNAKHNDRHK
jgi:hypothetical protein